METLKHWTEETDDFLHRVIADFVLQIENYLGESNQNELADKLGVSAARVSQVLNNPRNIKMRTAVEFARALGKKVALVAYDDRDPENAKGPINSQVFERCWQTCNRPRDFFDLEDNAQS